MMNVFDGDQPHEIRMGMVVVEREFGEPTDRLLGLEQVKLQSRFVGTNLGVLLLDDRRGACPRVVPAVTPGELGTESVAAELPAARYVDARYLHWLYDENPLGPSYDHHIDDDDGVRVGHYALIPQRYRNRDGEQPFVFSLNAVARSGRQRRGFFGRIGSEIWSRAQADGVKFIVAVCNEKSTGAVGHSPV